MPIKYRDNLKFYLKFVDLVTLLDLKKNLNIIKKLIYFSNYIQKLKPILYLLHISYVLQEVQEMLTNETNKKMIFLFLK